MNKKTFFAVCFFTIIPILSSSGQNIDYYMFNCSSAELTSYLNHSKQYIKGVNRYSANNSNFTIQFYNTTGIYANYKFKNIDYFSSIVWTINSKALFRFKYCTDYNSSIVYNFETSSGNKVRCNYDELTIQIQYPSSLNSFLDSNSEFTPVSVCTSKVSYAYHTNIKCEGLQNCEKQIIKSNIKEAKKQGYRICEICTTISDNGKDGKPNSAKNLNQSDLVNNTASSITLNNNKLIECERDFQELVKNYISLKDENAGLAATVTALRESNQLLINSSKEMTILSTKGAENIEKALISIKEKDMKIRKMQDALIKKDSLTLILVKKLEEVQSFKKK